MEQKKDYNLLRPFDLEAAKRGETVCYALYENYKEVKFIAEAGPDGDHVIRGEEGNLIFSREQYLRMAPLCWVEGRPVYKGDVLYFKDMQGAFQRFEVLRASDSDTLWANIGWMPSNELTWTPPKVKREGWVNIYQSQLEGIVAYVSFAYASKDSADDIAAPGRIACVRIEWEE